ncbi:MAG: type II toxin-antitoxin system VapC family toxin [Alphaproteobacteria bacterium]|nr:type II toxin-antitoxin system VapC family toxin [Alphaproteobacteria bacterium]
MYLLDTDVISEMRKRRPHGGVARWLSALKPDEVALSVMTIAEVQKGIERMRVSDTAKAAELEAWLDELCGTIRIHDTTEQIMRLWARFTYRHSVDLFGDALIAATALHHGLTVATRNTKDFLPYGVLVTNPWRAAQ